MYIAAHFRVNPFIMLCVVVTGLQDAKTPFLSLPSTSLPIGPKNHPSRRLNVLPRAPSEEFMLCHVHLCILCSTTFLHHHYRLQCCALFVGFSRRTHQHNFPYLCTNRCTLYVRARVCRHVSEMENWISIFLPLLPLLRATVSAFFTNDSPRWLRLWRRGQYKRSCTFVCAIKRVSDLRWLSNSRTFILVTRIP